MQRSIVTESFVVEKPLWVKENPTENSFKFKNNINGNRWNSEPPPNKQRFGNGPVFNSDKEPRFKIPDKLIKFGEVFTATIRKQFGEIWCKI